MKSECWRSLGFPSIILRPREGSFLAQGHKAHGRAKTRTQVSWFPVSTQGRENGQLRGPLPKSRNSTKRGQGKNKKKGGGRAGLRRELLRGGGPHV